MWWLRSTMQVIIASSRSTWNRCNSRRHAIPITIYPCSTSACLQYPLCHLLHGSWRKPGPAPRSSKEYDRMLCWGRMVWLSAYRSPLRACAVSRKTVCSEHLMRRVSPWTSVSPAMTMVFFMTISQIPWGKEMFLFFPRIFVWGACFWFCIPPAPPPPPPPPPPPSFTHNFVTCNFVNHHLSHSIFVNHHLSQTTLSTTIFHTHFCHPTCFTNNCVTYNFATHHLSRTTLSTTIFHTPSLSTTILHTELWHHLSHTSLSTTIFSHNFIHHVSHTTLSHTIFHKQLCHTHTHNFVTHPLSRTNMVASTFLSRGMRGTRRHPPSFHVAAVALGDIDLRLAWQARHNVETCDVSFFYCYVRIFGDIGDLAMLVTFACETCQ